MESIDQLSFDDIGPTRRRKMSPAEKYPAPGLKRCGSCYEVLPLDQYGNESGTRDGRTNNCIPCIHAYVERRKQEGKNLDPRWHDRHLRNTYGITADEYDRMLAAQGGVCAICGETAITTTFHKRLHVDHDHTTGVVRGILCQHCNRALGMMRENPGLLRAAADYLERHMT